VLGNGGDEVPRSELRLPEPPDDFRPVLDFPAETNPPLRDRPPFPVPEGVSDRREIEVQAAPAGPSARTTARLLSVATASPAVKRLLGRSFATIGLRQALTKEGRETVAVFYSYTNQWAVEVRIDPRAGVVSAEPLRVQPPLTEEEAALAVRLARDVLGVEAERLEAGTMAITREDPDDALAGRRLADVRLFPADERPARYFAVVDLAESTVIDSGRV
jgi:hypothetical protein